MRTKMGYQSLGCHQERYSTQNGVAKRWTQSQMLRRVLRPRVLIYTAAGDSEGTMGGLVRMGEPGQLDRTITRALDRARWCSSD